MLLGMLYRRVILFNSLLPILIDLNSPSVGEQGQRVVMGNEAFSLHVQSGWGRLTNDLSPMQGEQWLGPMQTGVEAFDFSE